MLHSHGIRQVVEGKWTTPSGMGKRSQMNDKTVKKTYVKMVMSNCLHQV